MYWRRAWERAAASKRYESNYRNHSMALLERVIKSFKPFPIEELKKYELIKAKMNGENSNKNNVEFIFRPAIFIWIIVYFFS